MADRTVHARYPGMEIVRYDRAGKWFFEPTNPMLKRQQVSIAHAAEQAVWASENGGAIYFGLPGGKHFDSQVRKLLEPYVICKVESE